ncbi:MAG: hypothetical protein SVU32_06500 [Candidatus Nanohaloarchaea archaeon]|nr:hypothetical protein [Candidatus Nanohaloarchaea archaeon]
MDLIDEDRPINRPQYAVLFLVAVFTLSYSLARGFIAAQQRQVLLVYPLAALAWTGYLVAHYCTEGIFLHPVQSESRLPTTRFEFAMTGVGAVLLLSGIGYFAVSVSSGSTLQGTFGALLFLAGYITTHYGIEKDFL